MPILSRVLIAAVAFAAAASAADVLASKSSDEHEALQQQIEELEKGQAKMMKDLEEIKSLLQRSNRPSTAGQTAFKPTDTKVDNVAFRGDEDAPVTLIEFSDYHCPYCKRHATTVMPALFKQYVDTGKVRFVMREYPIERLHPRSVAAAEVVLCAGDQGRYWEMHDALFEDQKSTSDEHFQQLASNLGLDMAEFQQCLDGDKFMERIKSDIAEGQRLGISGTPSFVVGLTDPQDSGTVHLTKFIRGAQGQPAFSSAIEELLKSAEKGK